MPSKTQAPALLDERLVTALSHPVRAHALTVCTERPASAKEIGIELGEETNFVAYHLKKLVELSCIEEVTSRKNRGATERFYRSTVPHFLDQAAWEAVPAKDRLKITMGILGEISKDVSNAVLAETIDESDNHISRTVLALDRAGWDEIVARLAETLQDVLAIRARSVERMASSEEQPIGARVEILHFRSPPRGTN